MSLFNIILGCYIFISTSVLIGPQPAFGGDLYPSCTGNVLSAKVVGGSKKVLHTVKNGGLFTQLLMTCFAYKVTSLSSPGICEVSHQTTLPFRLYIRASGTLDNGSPYESLFDVKDVEGGSVNRLTITPLVDSKFELVFENTKGVDCMMEVNTIFTHEIPSTVSQAKATIVQVDPPTVFQHFKTHFVVKHPDGSNHSKGLISLVPKMNPCSQSPIRISLDLEKDPRELKSYLTSFASVSDHYSVWKLKDPIAGNYKVCASVDGTDTKAAEISVLTVFGGNPQYFEIIEGSGEQGQVYVHKMMTLKFSGYNLDTRKGGDTAKLVDDNTTCKDGAAAGGVPEAVDLSPKNSWGPLTTFTTWTITIRRDGAFKVCYKPNATSIWVEVPSIDDLPPGVAPNPPTTNPPIPYAKNGDACPLAISRTPKDRKFIHSYLKIIMKGDKVPSYFRSILVDALCVPPGALVFERILVNTDKKAVLFLDIYCPDGVCGSQDRKDFLLQIAEQKTSKFQELGILEVKEVSSTGILSLVDLANNGISQKSHKTEIIVAIGCITLVLLAGFALFGYIQYQKNKHHFIEFGTHDDDDDEDLDIVNELPPRQPLDFIQ
eukprot:Tbor_TRINITY_DN6122_c4_g5::TRINITY_DN6122_c4_g5_i1::g.22778::m.22778